MMRATKSLPIFLVALMMPLTALADPPEEEPTFEEISWVGPRSISSDDPQPLYAVFPDPVEIAKASLRCGEEEIVLGPPTWSHSVGIGHAWTVPHDMYPTPNRCILEVTTDRERSFKARTPVWFRKRGSEPTLSLDGPTKLIEDQAFQVGISGLAGEVRFRLISLEEPRKQISWKVTLEKEEELRALKLPETPPTDGEYLLTVEAPGGRSAVSEHPVYYSAPMLVDLDEIRLERSNQVHSWLIFTGEGVEEITHMTLHTSGGDLPLVVEEVEGTSMPTIRTRVRTVLVDRTATLALQVGQQEGRHLRINLSEALVQQ